MKNAYITARILALGCLVLALAACDKTDPLGGTVITAHGNTDWHIDTAEEFLYGTQMDGATSAANHVPDSWIKRHMHIGGSNMATFYQDNTIVGGGQDTDSSSGIDRAMLFFYAGHGAPTFWNALGTNPTQSSMLLGNYSEDNPGLLRYYWQCSCDVFAHGPSTCAAGTGTDFEYSCPEQFDGSADSSSMRNVFERWGPALGPNLRMACGSSTLAYCHESETNRIWDNYNNKSYDVADSFIYGLHADSGSRADVVPLCITRGNASVSATPLYDQTFTPKKNPVGDGNYLHIQFMSNFRNNMPRLVFQMPDYLPLYVLRPLPLPDPLRNIQFLQEGELLLSPEQIDKRGAKVRVSTASGSVAILGDIKREATANPLKEETYVSSALEFLRSEGLYESDTQPAFGTAMKFQSQSGDKAVAEQQKNVKVVFKRTVPVEGLSQPVPVLGEGGLLEVNMNNDASVFASIKVWRELASVKENLPVKPYGQALEEALKQVGDTQNYKLRDWAFGYKEESGNVAQETLGVVYEFNFEAVNDKLVVQYPPRTIEVGGFARQ